VGYCQETEKVIFWNIRNTMFQLIRPEVHDTAQLESRQISWQNGLPHSF